MLGNTELDVFFAFDLRLRTLKKGALTLSLYTRGGPLAGFAPKTLRSDLLVHMLLVFSQKSKPVPFLTIFFRGYVVVRAQAPAAAASSRRLCGLYALPWPPQPFPGTLCALIASEVF